MGAISHIRGHKIIFNNGWKFADNSTPIKEENRPCIRCGKMPDKQGHDHCIQRMDKITHACCGHGVNDNRCYIRE